MKLGKFIVILVTLMFCATSQAGTTWDIIRVRQYGSELSLHSREEGLRELQKIVDNTKKSHDVKVFAHYSIAALYLGQLAPLVLPASSDYRPNGGDQFNGFSLIYIDRNQFFVRENRASAKEHLEKVVSGLGGIKGALLSPASDLIKELSYAYLYLGLIDNAEGNYESALSYYNQFQNTGFLSAEGQQKVGYEIRDVTTKLNQIENQRLAEERAVKQAEIENEKAIQAQEEEQARLAEEARVREIQSRPEYKRKAAEEEIRVLRSQLEQLHSAMEEEHRIGRISGYVNATRMHDLGANVVASENQLSEQWVIYKRNGGKAKSLYEIQYRNDTTK